MRFSLVSWLACGVLLGCDPGVFSRATQPVSIESSHATPDSGAPDGDEPAAGSGGRAVSDAGRGGNAGGTSSGAAGKRAVAGAGGRAISAGAGGAVADGGAGAAAGKAAGAGGASAPACPPAALDHVTVTMLRDDVLQTPASLGDVQSGPAVALQDRVLWFVNARAQQDRSMPAFITFDSVRSESPQLLDSGSSMLLLQDEQMTSALSAAPTGAWKLDGDPEGVGFFFSRFTYLTPRGLGLGRSSVATPAPAQVLIAPDVLFPAPAAADGGTGVRPELLTGVLHEGELLYAYDCNARDGVDDETQATGAHFQPCRLLRVPATQFSDGSHYEFYSDGAWVSDFTRASIVIDHVPGALSVVRNAYLKKLLAVHSGAGNNLQLAWADEPQGPFHDIGSIATVAGTFGALPLSHAGREIAIPHMVCDPELVAAYTVPLAPLANDPQDTARPETHVVRLRLQ